jgi:hypothetical protein
MIKTDWQNELFADKSFTALYRTARSHVAVRSTTVLVAAVFLISVVPILLGFMGAWSPLSLKVMVTGIRTVTTLGVAFATSILGFLVSGFALFFAITRSDVLVLLAGVPHEQSKISRLQFILCSFMYVFLHYIIYLGAMLAISVTLSPGSVLNGTAAYLRDQAPNGIRAAAALMFGASAAWLMFTLLLLKTFIWNLFQTVLIAISVGADMDSGRLDHLLQALRAGSDPDSDGVTDGS